MAKQQVAGNCDCRLDPVAGLFKKSFYTLNLKLVPHRSAQISYG